MRDDLHRVWRWTVVAVVVSGPAAAQGPGPAEAERRRVVAGEGYRAGALHQFLLGRDYRELWTAPVELPVLRLEAFAGGARPVRRLGHGQSKALALRGADGRAYTFRPVIKDPTGLLPEELRETFVRRLLLDQMASGHPAGHVVVPELLAAAGVLHNEPRLVVLADDPALGEFREDFGDVVGDIEEWGGSPGFAGAVDNIDGAELWRRLDTDPGVRIDSRNFLAARLVDHLIGDWDRHRNQWRWVRLPGAALWRPVPEDRDQAFVKFEGLAIAMIRPSLPLLVRFGPRHSSLDGLTFDSWDVDRRLLADLDRDAWREVAAEVQARLTDDVIEAAARRMPPEYFAIDGQSMIAALVRRRDALSGHAQDFYRFLAREVDVDGTDAAERAEVVRHPDGSLELSVAPAAAAGPEAPAYFRRRFRPGETREVRLKLRGGDDRVVVRGGGRGGVLLRVVGGDGDDVLDDSAGGGTRYYDARGNDRVQAGLGTAWDRKPYPPPPPNPSAAWIPARDWGRRTRPLFRVTGGSDLGAFLSAAVVSTGYGFRKHPYADHQRLRVGYATGARGFRAEYHGDFLFENSRWWARIEARASQIDVLRFYGFGNQTPAAGPDDRFKIEQGHYAFEPSLGRSLGRRGQLWFGPVVRYSSVDARDNPVLAAGRPYGAADFGQVGVRARLAVDTTDRPGIPHRGLLVAARASFYPALLDVDRAFGGVGGEVAAFVSARGPLAPTLVLRAGGERVWGRYPFHDAAFVGGGSVLSAGPVGGGGAAVRGLPPQRYAGDAAVYGGAELRLALTPVFVFVPAELGLFGLVDAGRVYLDDEVSDRWHTGLGGGIWLASPGRRNAVSLGVAWSEGRTGLYVRTGFTF